jgi:NAD+ synthase
MKSKFTPDILKIDCEKEAAKITERLRSIIRSDLQKRGAVVALSGGIDSSVVGALCVEALDKDHVLGLLLPEKDSSPETIRLSRVIADHLSIKTVHEEITPILKDAGCYSRRDEAIQSVIPEYDSDYTCKIVLPNLTDSDQYRIFSVVVRSPDGKETKARLTPSAYSQIVAATSFKQRVRKMMEYYHADRLNYAVIGTPNRQEYDQGFFVKLGDGAADVKPIAHLYKTQVYQMAAYFNLPEEIQHRPPTTDTYSMEQSQEEFYFSVPYDQFDLCLYGKNHNIPSAEVAEVTGLTEDQVERVYADILNKRKATHHLHIPPVLIEEVKEIKG